MYGMSQRQCMLVTVVVIGILGQAQMGMSLYNQATDSLPLTSNSGTLSQDGTHLRINLDSVEQNELKRRTHMVADDASTYLSALGGLVNDLKANPSVVITEDQALPVGTYTEDTTAPALTKFELDMNLGHLDLYFTETVQVSTIVVSEIVLQVRNLVDVNNPGETFPLFEGAVAGVDDTFVRIVLTDNEMNGIKQLSTLAISQTSTFLSIGTASIQDMNNNAVTAIEPTAAEPAFDYTPDTTAPTLTSCALNLDTGTISYVFSETIKRSDTICSSLALLGAQSAIAAKFGASSDCTVVNNNAFATTMEVTLSEADLNVLKANTGVATDSTGADTFCTIQAAGITDMNSQSIVTIVETAAVLSAFSPDVTAPVIRFFSLSMNTGIMTITFSETVKASTTVAHSITFNDEQTNQGTYTLQHGSAVVLPIGDESPIVTVQIDITDLNEMKRLTYIATDVTNTVLTIDNANFVVDMAGLPLAFNAATITACSVLTPDSIAPTLTAADVDMDTSVLTLTFSETVDSSTIDPTRFIFIDADSGTQTYQLTGANSKGASGAIVAIGLTTLDMNTIKKNTALLTGSIDSYIYSEAGVVAFEDMAANDAEVIEPDAIVGPLGYAGDVTDPTLLTWSISIDQKTLTLTFDETMQNSEVVVTELTLHDNADGSGESFSFTTESSVVSAPDSTEVTISIGNGDMNIIKAKENLAISLLKSYLAMTVGAAKDMVNRNVNIIDASTPKRATSYEGDKTAPEFVGFDLNLNLVNPSITFSFSETVRAATAVANKIRFINPSTNPLQAYTLTDISMVDVNQGTVSGALTVADTDELKKLALLCGVAQPSAAASDCYIDLEEGAFRDMETAVVASGHSNGAQRGEVVALVVDTIKPLLVSYTLDMSVASSQLKMSLTFSETVDPSTMVAGRMGLTGELTGGAVIGLGLSTTASSVGTVVEIIVNEVNADDVKLVLGVAALESNTFLALAEGFIQDAANNAIEQVIQAVATAGYSVDDVAPKISSLTVNMDAVTTATGAIAAGDVNTATITFNFDEPVDANTFRPTAVTLVDLTSGAFHMLTGGDYTMVNGRQVVLSLTIADLNVIKQKDTLFIDLASSYVTIDATGLGLVKDMAGVVCAGITDQQVSSYDADTTAPVIVTFDVNMDSGLLLLTFQETVDASTLQLGFLRLQRVMDCAASSTCTLGHTLTGGQHDVSADHKEVTVQLSEDDLNEIKRKEICLLSEAGCWLAAADGAINDMNAQQLTSTTNGANAKQATSLTKDSGSPNLESFTFAIDGSILLTFSETVNFGSIDLTTIGFQPQVGDGSANDQYRLTASSGDRDGSSVVGSSSTILEIALGKDDKDDLKRMPVGASIATFITFTSSFIKDMTGNAVVAIASPAALQTSSFFDDTTDPTLVAFTIDMSEAVAVLALTFSETVDFSTLDPSDIYLQSTINGAGAQTHKLEGGAVSTTLTGPYTDDTVVYIDVIHSDRTAIEAKLQLAISDTSTFMYFASSMVADMNARSIVGIDVGTSKTVAEYISDVTPPSLVSFTLDLTTEELTLTFSETVDVASIAISSGNAKYQLVGNADCTDGLNLDMTASVWIVGTTDSADGPEIIVKLSLDTLNTIKAQRGLATSLENTYIIVRPGAVSDTVFPVKNVYSEVVSCSSPLLAGVWVRDQTSPVLDTAYTLNLNTGEMVLYFSETVELSDFVGAELFLTDGVNPAVDVGFAAGSSLADSHGTNPPVDVYGKVTIQLSVTALNTIKFRDTMGKDQATSKLYFSNFLVKDMQGNAVTAIGAADAVVPFVTSRYNVVAFTPDTTAAELQFASLDLTTGFLKLEFDEAVRLSSLQMNQMTIQAALILSTGQAMDNTPTSDIVAHTVILAEGQMQYSDNVVANTIVIALSQTDLDSLKLVVGLADSADTTNFVFSNTLIEDMLGNDVTAGTLAVKAGGFVADVTKPELVGFSIALSSEELSITFSEAVLAASVKITGITLQDSQQAFVAPGSTDPDYAHKLTSGTVTSGNGYIQVIKMATYDLDHLKRLSRVATSDLDTFLLIVADDARDMNSNPVVEIIDGNAVKATGYATDTIAPSLLSYRFQMATDGPPLKMYLRFSETVDIENFDVTKLILQDAGSINDATSSHRLTGGDVAVVPMSTTP